MNRGKSIIFTAIISLILGIGIVITDISVISLDKISNLWTFSFLLIGTFLVLPSIGLKLREML